MDPVTMAVVGAGLGAGAGFLGGSKKKKAQFDPYGTLNPEQRSLVQALGPQLQSSATQGPQYYTGSLTADMSPEEASYYSPSRAALMGGTIDTMMQEANDPVAFRNRFQEEMADPAYRNFEMNEAGRIGEGYSGFSTARAGALANARATLGNNLLMSRYQALQDTKNRALNAYNAVPTIQNYLATPRVFRQAGLDRKYKDYVGANERAQSNIDNALKFLGISTATYTPEQKDTRWSGALSGALKGFQLGSGFSGMMDGGGGLGLANRIAPFNNGNSSALASSAIPRTLPTGSLSFGGYY